METRLLVLAVAPAVTKNEGQDNECTFKKVTFAEIMLMDDLERPGIKIAVPIGVARTRNIFSDNSLFGYVSPNKYVPGSFEKGDVEAYEYNGNTYEKATVVRLGKETVEEAFRANGHTIMTKPEPIQPAISFDDIPVAENPGE